MTKAVTTNLESTTTKVNAMVITNDNFDNQLNQFIALVKGERELSQRGRKPNPNTVTKKSEEDKAVTEDKEFEQFMNDFNSTLTKNKAVQVKADQAKEAIVTSTVSKFAEIKQEVNTLKNELNEVKQTLDSVSNDTAISFNILPISRNKEN